ncbi:MAG: DUF1800 family protein [Alphaproteobacteria bacterium]|nr:DUF1800 family protein [Alphaproteobacteria bacterium]
MVDPQAVVTAFNRFGLGAKPGDLALAASDPRGMLASELKAPGVAEVAPEALGSSIDALQRLFLDQKDKRMARERAATEPPIDTSASSDQSAAGAAKQGASQTKPQGPSLEQKLYRGEAMARFRKAFSARVGFVERLVAFWSNHFAVSVSKGQFIRVVAGPFEREAIRPFVLGKFAQMLMAVESHPAMIFYLDNQRSIGPNAAAGRLSGKGLNENLAREILELHTLGVGGYRQIDVTELARIITGWSFAEAESEVGEPGAFVFKANWHEPGPHSVLGKVYPQRGRDQGEAALLDLARHPATANHIAMKLARHFVADAPPPDLVQALSRKFRDTDGDLMEVSLALIQDERAWRAPATKIRTPAEFLLAAARAMDFLPDEPGPILHLQNLLGMPLWQPGGSNGFSDSTSEWAAPEAMKLRLDVSWRLAQRFRDVGHPLGVLDIVAGLAASRETRDAIAHAESRQEALALLFMSPEFQRR